MLTLKIVKSRTLILEFVAMLMSALLLSSCAKVSRVQADTEIVMSPRGSSLTKAVTIPLETTKEFGVYAFYADCAGGTAWTDPQAWANSTDYFSDAVFKYSDGYWGGYPDPYYWPLSGSLMLAGYCPHQSVSDAITSVSFEPNKADVNPYLQIEFTQNTVPAEMVDLLWFDVEDSGMGKTLSKTADPIDVQFKHALSKVKFQFADNYNHYKLSSVILEGSVNKGRFYSGRTQGWLPDLTVVAPYTLLAAGSDSNPLLNDWVSPDLYIIPQYLDGIFPSLGTNLDSGVDVVLTFTLTDLESFGSQTISIPLKDYTYRWEVGDYYHYTITVNSDPIEFGTPEFEITLQTVAM